MLEGRLDIASPDLRMVGEKRRAEGFGIGDEAALVVGLGDEPHPHPELPIRQRPDLAVLVYLRLECPNPGHGRLRGVAAVRSPSARAAGVLCSGRINSRVPFDCAYAVRRQTPGRLESGFRRAVRSAESGQKIPRALRAAEQFPRALLDDDGGGEVQHQAGALTTPRGRSQACHAPMIGNQGGKQSRTRRESGRATTRLGSDDSRT